MKSHVCVLAIYDRAAQAFAQPMFMASPAVALRQFVSQVNDADKNNGLHVYAADYELHYLADYVEETGEFVEAEGGKRLLARGADVLNRKE